MAQVYREHREVTTGANHTDGATVSPSRFLVRLVNLVSGILLSLLGLRFILALVGANKGNPFTDFVYSITHPFVAPFFGIFNYQPQFGVVRFEFETLLAMLVYAFVAWVIIQVVALGRNDDDVDSEL